MVDFSRLTKRTFGEAKLPPALPPGLYQGIIRANPELREAPADNASSVIVRVHVGLMAWPDSFDDRDRQDSEGHPIDLSKRRLRRDFYCVPKDEEASDTGLFYLEEFIRSCGIDGAGRPIEEVLPELVGRSVEVEVQQYVNQRTNEVGNQVGKLTGLGT